MANQDVLKSYHNKIKVMCIVCNKGAGYYLRYKNLIIILSLLFTFLSGLLNTIDVIANENKKYIGIFDFFVFFIINLNRAMRYDEKSSHLKQASKSFQNLSNDIDKEKNRGEISNDFINLIISLYENINNNLDEAIPAKIMMSVEAEYEGMAKNDLPLIFGKFSPSLRSVKRNSNIGMKPTSGNIFGSNTNTPQQSSPIIEPLQPYSGRTGLSVRVPSS